MSAIPKAKWGLVKKLYLSELPMREVALRLNVSLDAVTYAMRKSAVPRRSLKEASRLAFEAKTPSFAVRKSRNPLRREMELIGAMLYWAEGYKRETASGVDFANSDPDMAALFFHFLMTRYILDTQRLYFSVYHYSDQDLAEIIKFWAKKLGVSASAFRHSYRKENPNLDSRKLPYGVLHIRYNDKKLLRDMLSLIESYKRKYILR